MTTTKKVYGEGYRTAVLTDDYTGVHCHICTVCDKAYLADQMGPYSAKRCCMTHTICPDCETEIPATRYSGPDQLCSNCRSKKDLATWLSRVDKATLVDEADAGDQFFDDRSDTYWPSTDDYLDGTFPGDDQSEFLFCTKLTPPRMLHAGEIMENLWEGYWDTDEIDPPLNQDIPGFADLVSAINKINDWTQTSREAQLYWPDYTRKVRVDIPQEDPDAV